MAAPIKSVIIIFLLMVSSIAEAQQLNAGAKFDYFSRIERESQGETTAERARRIGDAYDKTFGHYALRDLASLSDETLEQLFRATNVAVFYVMREDDLDQFNRIYQEIDSRGLSSSKHQNDVFGAHVSMRLFSKAKNLREKWGRDDLEPIPTVLHQIDTVEAGPTFLEIENNQVLVRRSLSPSQNPVIVIVSHPLCHFSRNAVQALEDDAEAAEVILKHAIWLAPADRRLYLSVLEQWNQEHPRAKVHLAHKREEWPLLDSWSTPTFYFFEDRILKAKIVGWPEGGVMSELIEAAHLIGLLTPDHHTDRK